MKTVFVADSPAEAHLVLGLLEDAGIRCVVEGEMLFGVRGDLGLTPSSLPRVCVADEDAARAAELIAGVGRRGRGEPPPDPDPDAEAPARPWRGAAKIAVLWALAGAVGGLATGGAAVALAGVCLFVHLYVHFERAT